MGEKTMARVRMVTRTIEVMEYSVITMDLADNNATKQVTLELTGDKLEGEKALKQLRKQYETDTYKLVAIVGTNTREELYGMLEIDFLKQAKKLDPETRKLLEE